VRSKLGNFDGFATSVTMVPDLNLGFMALTNCGSLDASVLTNPALAKLIPTFAEEIMSDLLSPPLPKNYSEYEGI